MLHRLSPSLVNPMVRSRGGCSQLMDVLDACIFLCAVPVYFGVCRADMRAADHSCSNQIERISVAGCPSRRRDRLTPSLCRGLGQLPKEPQQAATAVGQITCSGHTREDARPPRLPASGTHFVQSHIPLLTWPDGVRGWKIPGVTLGPLKPSPYFQPPSLILVQRTHNGRRWKGRL